MLKVVLLFLYILTLYANDFQIKGNTGIDYKYFNYDSKYIENKEQKTLELQFELKQTFDNNIFFTKVETIKDFEDKDRQYIKFNELYYKYQSDNYDLIIGKDIKYWGALEVYNIADIYNKKNILYDKFDKDKKLGTVGITYNYFLQNDDEVSVILAKDITKDENLSTYIKYIGSSDDILQVDYGFIVDINKKIFSTFDTLLYKNSIFKFEYLYDFDLLKYKVGIGLEYTIYSIFSKNDLGLLLEYYNDNSKYFIYKKSKVFAMRYSFNDVSNSDMLVATIIDDDNNINVALEANTKFYDSFKMKLSYLKRVNIDIFGININYYF